MVALRSISTEYAFKLAPGSRPHQLPRHALGPALMELKRAAEAKKCQRIAGRLAALAEAKAEGSAHMVGGDRPRRRMRLGLGGKS